MTESINYLNEVASRLADTGATLATAESCTGGLVSAAFTDLAGSSAYFLGGVISYSNEAKKRHLGVQSATLVAEGAVSSSCAEQMAVGAREAFGADWGLSTTGIAGPGGAVPGKPIGTVYVSVAGPAGVKSWRLQLHGDREQVRKQTVSQLVEYFWEMMNED